MSPNEMGDGVRALPEHPNLEHLKHEAKARLRELRQADPKAKLSLAQFQVARSYGFASWRALKAKVDRLSQASGANAFANLIGHYMYDPAVMSNTTLTVSTENGRLYIQLTGRSRFEVFDKGGGRFSMAGLEGYYTFEGAEAWPATTLMIHGRSSTARAERTTLEDVARADVRRAQALAEQQAPRTAIAVGASTLALYVGHYASPAGISFEVMREDERLFVQLVGQPRFEVSPEAPAKFFWRIGALQMSFVVRDGACTGAVIHEEGRETMLTRVSEDEASRGTTAIRERLAEQQLPRTAVAIDPAKLDDYVGAYQFTSQVRIAVTREADRLFVAFGAQPAMAVFPESDDKFFWEKIACQVSFARDQPGRATHATLHQMGRLIPMGRIADDEPQRRRSA